MAKYVFDAVATIGTYIKDGQEKKQYLKVGKVFENDKGQMSMKLDALPVGKDWSGWISLYEPSRDGEQRNARPSTNAPAVSPRANTESAASWDNDDTIPF
jgi:hypothetical protein